MAVIHSPESPSAQELAKWEAFPTSAVPRPLRPHTHREYPKMLYKAGRLKGGPVGITDHLIAKNEAEHQQFAQQGWCDRQEDALERFHGGDRDIAIAAANRAYHDRTMSPQAQAEVAAAEAAHDGHLPEKPVTPIKKLGRPVKVKE